MLKWICLIVMSFVYVEIELLWYFGRFLCHACSFGTGALRFTVKSLRVHSSRHLEKVSNCPCFKKMMLIADTGMQSHTGAEVESMRGTRVKKFGQKKSYGYLKRTWHTDNLPSTKRVGKELKQMPWTILNRLKGRVPKWVRMCLP
jgi:hypothetical protein